MKKNVFLLFLLSGLLQACGEFASVQPTLTASPRPSATLTHTPTFTATSTLTPTVTATPTLTYTPTPTPFAGGGRIAFWVWSLSNPVLYTINQDGTDLQALFDSTEHGYSGSTTGEYEYPVWSPSGRYFFFSKYTGLSTFQYYLFDSQSGEVNLLAELPYFPFCAWEPDEEAIICSVSARHPSVDSIPLGLYRVPILDPQEPVELILAFDEFCEAGYIWSVSGENEYLLYISGWHSGDNMTELVLVNEDCEVQETLYSATYNEKVNLLRQNNSGLLEDPFFFILVDSTRNANRTVLNRYSFADHSIESALETDRYTMGYQISPEGTMIAMLNADVFVTKVSDWLSNMYISNRNFQVMNIADQEIMFVDESPGYRRQMCWSRDGNFLFFGANRLEISNWTVEDILSPAGISLPEIDAGFACSP